MNYKNMKIGLWYRGKIQKQIGTDVYNIQYEDGFKEKEVAIQFIRRVRNDTCLDLDAPAPQVSITYCYHTITIKLPHYYHTISILFNHTVTIMHPCSRFRSQTATILKP
jgi:hypothetical protein